MNKTDYIHLVEEVRKHDRLYFGESRPVSGKNLREIMNTDREEFGGSGKINSMIEKIEDGFHLQLAPLATMVFEVVHG